jgi:uncharacterized damage-inducible protein DinB
MSQALVELFRHHLWANERLFESCARLDAAQLESTAPGTYGTIAATLQHIVANEENYLATLQAQPRPPAHEPFPGVVALRERAGATGEALIELAGRGEAAELAGEWGGRAYRMSAAVPLVQAIHHGTEHRAQIATVLSTLGIAPPAWDAWAFGQDPANGLLRWL